MAKKRKTLFYLIEYSDRINIEDELERFGIRTVNIEIVGWNESKNKDSESPNLISKISIIVPNVDYKNLENIFKSLSIKPIKKLSNMREKVNIK